MDKQSQTGKKIAAFCAAAFFTEDGMELVWQVLDAFGRGEIVKEIVSAGFLHFLGEPWVFITAFAFGLGFLLRALQEDKPTATPATWVDGKLLPPVRNDYRPLSRRSVVFWGIGGLSSGVLVALILLVMFHFGLFHRQEHHETETSSAKTLSTSNATSPQQNAVTPNPTHKSHHAPPTNAVLNGGSQTQSTKAVPTQSQPAPIQQQPAPQQAPLAQPSAHAELDSAIEQVKLLSNNWGGDVDSCDHDYIHRKATVGVPQPPTQRDWNLYSVCVMTFETEMHNRWGAITMSIGRAVDDAIKRMKVEGRRPDPGPIPINEELRIRHDCSDLLNDKGLDRFPLMSDLLDGKVDISKERQRYKLLLDFLNDLKKELGNYSEHPAP